MIYRLTYIRLDDPYLLLRYCEKPYNYEIMITRKCISFKSKSLLAHSPTGNGLLVHKRFLSTSRPLSAYSDTVPNLKIGEHTRVIFQGFTGRQVNLILAFLQFRTPSLIDSRPLKMPDNPLNTEQKSLVASRLARTLSTLDFLYCHLCEL